MHRILILLFAIAPCLLFAAVKPSLAADDGQTIFRFGMATPPNSFLSVLQSNVLVEAFQRNGWKLEIQYFSDNVKLVRLVEMGLIDGEVLREGTFADNGTHPGYVKVAAETVAGESGAYAIADLPVSDWKSLAELSVPVGFVLAEKFNANPLRIILLPKNMIGFKTRLKGFRALVRGEIQVFVMADHYHAMEMMRDPEFANTGIKRLAILSRFEGNAYFAKKHAALVPVLEQTLRVMKRDGTCDRILLEVIGYE